MSIFLQLGWSFLLQQIFGPNKTKQNIQSECPVLLKQY